MNALLEIKNEILMPAITDLLQSGKSVKLKITGNSMYPFLRHGVDSIKLIPMKFDNVKKYDIVLIKRENGDYVLHRVIKKGLDEFFIVGDAQSQVEGPIKDEQLVASVSGIWRKNRYISSSNIIYKSLVRFWMLLRPFRVEIIHKKARIQTYVRRNK